MQALRIGTDTAVSFRRPVISEEPVSAGGVDNAHPFPSSGKTTASFHHVPINQPPSETYIPPARAITPRSLF